MKLSDRLRLQAAAAAAATGEDPAPSMTDEAATAADVPVDMPMAVAEPVAVVARPLAALLADRVVVDPQAELKLRLRMALYGRRAAP
jgi:hypothetical protein